MIRTFIGIDPGLVHTGTVVMRVNEKARSIVAEALVIEGDQSHAEQVYQAMDNRTVNLERIFIESYRERANAYAEDQEMRELLADFRRLFPEAVVLDNTGVKKVVTRHVMEVFGMNDFPATHHRDLESAARIMLYGIMKDDILNALTYQIVADYINGFPWEVMTIWRAL